MNKKINIKEIEQMLPDFISGKLSENDRKKVRESLEIYPELNAQYLEFKKVMEFVSSVKFEEPSPQYWVNLPSRIHDKIEQRKQSKKPILFEGFAVSWWKIALPAAALVLIFVIYKAFTPQAPDIPRNQKIVSNIDTVKKTQTSEGVTLVEEEKIVKKTGHINSKRQKLVPQITYSEESNSNPKTDELQIFEEELSNGKEVEWAYADGEDSLNDYTITSPLDEVETIYEESEKEYNNLTPSEKSEVLEKLKEINLK